jgi:hypothetical protein
MATAKVIDEKGYLLEAYRELHGMVERINTLRADLAAVYGGEGKVFRAHDRQLSELADYIGWKLMVLEKGTGFDWPEKDVESIVSVRPPDIAGPDFSGGYMGG